MFIFSHYISPELACAVIGGLSTQARGSSGLELISLTIK